MKAREYFMHISNDPYKNLAEFITHMMLWKEFNFKLYRRLNSNLKEKKNIDTLDNRNSFNQIMNEVIGFSDNYSENYMIKVWDEISIISNFYSDSNKIGKQLDNIFEFNYLELRINLKIPDQLDREIWRSINFDLNFKEELNNDVIIDYLKKTIYYYSAFSYIHYMICTQTEIYKTTGKKVIDIFKNSYSEVQVTEILKGIKITNEKTGISPIDNHIDILKAYLKFCN